MADPEKKQATQDKSYRGKRVQLCTDGKYRWQYEVNMYTNPAIFLTVYKIFFWTIVIGFSLFAFFLRVIPGDWEGLAFAAKGMLIALAGFFVLTLLGYLVVALMYHGKYVVLFEMNDKEVSHIQIAEQYRKAQKIGVLTALVGIAAKRPGTVGAGMMSTARQASTSVFANVRKVKPRRRMHLIKVNQLLNKNQVYVPEEDYDFVYDYIKSHCPQAK